MRSSAPSSFPSSETRRQSDKGPVNVAFIMIHQFSDVPGSDFPSSELQVSNSSFFNMKSPQSVLVTSVILWLFYFSIITRANSPCHDERGVEGYCAGDQEACIRSGRDLEPDYSGNCREVSFSSLEQKLILRMNYVVSGIQMHHHLLNQFPKTVLVGNSKADPVAHSETTASS
jgi:hypothetical protein